MRKGGIDSQNGICWVAEQVVPGEADRVRLSPYSLLISTVEAWYCPDCRKVIIDAPELESPVDIVQRKWKAFADEQAKKRAEQQAERAGKKHEQRAAERRKKDPWEVD